MPARSPELRHKIAKTAATARWRGRAEAEEAKAALAVDLLEEYIKRLVDEAPPLTPEQRDRLRVLLRGDATTVATSRAGGRVAS